MNIPEIMESDHDWEAEKKRRIRYHRNRLIKEAFGENSVLFIILIGILLELVVLFVHAYTRLPVLERAAYLEGRFDLDHKTALMMAEITSNNH